MLKLRRLRIEKFRNVKPGTELRFSDGINVLLGQNGTGKTTLLELISSVVRSDFSAHQREELEIQYELAVEEASVVVALRNARQEGAQSLKAQLIGRETWRATMDARIDAKDLTVTLQSENGRLRVNGQPVEASGLASLLNPMIVAMTVGLYGQRDLLVPLTNGTETVRFDESLDLFRALMSSNRAIMILKETTLSLGQMFFVPMGHSSPIPKSLMPGLEARYQVNPTERHFVFSDRDLEFLASAVRIMGFASGQLHIDILTRKSSSDVETLIELGNLTFQFQHQEGGDLVFHDRLSYGEKRLLTFFYYLDMCPDVVIADELVNGLHHAWITAAIDAVGGRQAFLTSQNPLLLDYLPITSPEQVRSSFVFCRSERGDGRPRWSWQNMSESDAAELHAAYDVGVEHVSEILQSRGLW